MERGYRVGGWRDGSRIVVTPARARAVPPPAAGVMPLIDALKQAYPDAACALTHQNPFQLLVATILSAQCTDARVNLVTPGLFAAHPDVVAMSRVSQEDLEEIIRSTGFFRNKAKSIRGAAQRIEAEFGGKVPRTMDALLSLPGVARKTANVVLGVGFGIADGVVVDTHVARLSRRLGLTRETGPEAIERDLMRTVPREEWIAWSHLLIFHGRQVCQARAPLCDRCTLRAFCPSAPYFLAGSKPPWEGKAGRVTPGPRVARKKAPTARAKPAAKRAAAGARKKK